MSGVPRNYALEPYRQPSSSGDPCDDKIRNAGKIRDGGKVLSVDEEGRFVVNYTYADPDGRCRYQRFETVEPQEFERRRAAASILPPKPSSETR